MDAVGDNSKSDVAAKAAFIRELQGRGIAARVTSTPADITALVDGTIHYYEVKFTRRSDNYFGAATLTEWEAALEHEGRFWFVVAFERDGRWQFHEYTPAEFMLFSSIPPFKLFFQVPVGDSKAPSPQVRVTRSVRLTRDRLEALTRLFATFRAPRQSPTESYSDAPLQEAPPSLAQRRSATPPTFASAENQIVGVGSRVTVAGRSEVFNIVVADSGGNGSVNRRSPLGAAIIGRQPGDTVHVHAPSGTEAYRVISVDNSAIGKA